MANELELVTGTLKVLREAFAGSCSRHDGCFCRWVIAEDDYRDRLAGQNLSDWRQDNIIATRGFGIREADIRFVSGEERASLLQVNPNAKFEKNSADEEVYYREPGISSVMHFRGDHRGRDQFDNLSADAGFCLIQFVAARPLTLKLPSLVPFESIAVVKSRLVSSELPSDLSERWMAFLHVLGWQNLAVSPLRAARNVWHGSTSFTGDPEELHNLVGDLPFKGIRQHIPMPPKFFASILSSDLNLASVYAIDVLLADLVAAPEINVAHFVETLAAIRPGQEHATGFHRLAKEMLSLVFEPDLHSPQMEERIHEGRGLIDIVFTNAADRGYFGDLAFRHQIKCPVVFFECKNYSGDVGPTEFAQLTSRFSDKRGKVGFVVCRAITNKELAQKRCRDAFQDKHEHVLVLDDADLLTMLRLKANKDVQGISTYLHEKFRPVFMDA